MNPTELVPLIQTGGALVCLLFAVRWLADKFTASQREIVDLLRGALQDNTKTLGEVRDSMRDCHARRVNQKEYDTTPLTRP